MPPRGGWKEENFNWLEKQDNFVFLAILKGKNGFIVSYDLLFVALLFFLFFMRCQLVIKMTRDSLYITDGTGKGIYQMSVNLGNFASK